MARGKQAGLHPELGLPEVRKLWQTSGLFSDHYLKARIRKNSWWPTDEQARPIWQFCQELYNKRYVACAQNNEAFTRQELLNKILEKLGFAWTDNLGLPDQDAEPDYILFSSTEEKEKVIEKSKVVQYGASVGILEAKKVNHPLSQISKHQQRYQRGAALDNWRRIIAAVIEPGNFCSDTVNYIANPKQLNLYTILALLNSSVWEWRFRLTSTNNHVNSYEIDSMPLARFSFTTPATERKRHVMKGCELYERCLAGNDAGDLLEFVEKQLREKRVDVIHDLLAFLAERMMALNKDKQTAAKQFLTDLKDFHGIEARSLTPKTKLDEFWKLQAGEVFAHFRANKLRLKEGDDEKLRARFQKAQNKLVPLESQVKFTDRLIDQIVYRLYDLTEDEIKLVEGSAKK